ncbi:unnamed protein product [Ixodes pacificus]
MPCRNPFFLVFHIHAWTLASSLLITLKWCRRSFFSFFFYGIVTKGPVRPYSCLTKGPTGRTACQKDGRTRSGGGQSLHHVHSRDRPFFLSDVCC